MSGLLVFLSCGVVKNTKSFATSQVSRYTVYEQSRVVCRHGGMEQDNGVHEMVRCCRRETFLHSIIQLDCHRRTEDWRPCEYPYTGLSAYTADAEYCFQTFAEGIPDEFVYFLGQLAYAALYLPFALMFGSRVLYMLVDLQVLACPVPFHPADQKYTRKNRVMNIHDQCNLLTLLAATIQSVRFLDLHAWQGIIPFAVYQLMGRVVRTLSVTVGSIIIKIWMNLISFWTPGTNTTSNRL